MKDKNIIASKKTNSQKTKKGEFKIGELVDSLSREFTNVSVSKVRYLEDKGLITPKRDPSGYRRYTEKDLAQLKSILMAQRDEHLPLEVIADKLKSGDIKIKAPSSSKMFIVNKKPKKKMTEGELLKAASSTPSQLKVLKESGVVSHGPEFSEDDLSVLRSAKPLLANGFEARHLKAFQRAAEQEADLALQITAPLFQKIEDREAFLKVDELATAGRDFRQALLKREFRLNL